MTHLSDTCDICERRIWFRDVAMDDNGDHHEYCKECITRMSAIFKVGRILGSVRPWSDPLIEPHIRLFLDPTQDPKAVLRRRFEVAWATILSGANSAFLGTSAEITIGNYNR